MKIVAPNYWVWLEVQHLYCLHFSYFVYMY